MQVKEILRVKGSRLLSIEPGGRAVDAVNTMAKENLGSLVVMEQGRLVGMLTFHELLRPSRRRRRWRSTTCAAPCSRAARATCR
jgi:CBS domain-containing protein